MSSAKEKGLRGFEDSSSEASLLLNGVFDPIQKFGDLSVDAWLLPAFLAPAHDPIDEVSAILFTGQRAPRVTLRGEPQEVSLVN